MSSENVCFILWFVLGASLQNLFKHGCGANFKDVFFEEFHGCQGSHNLMNELGDERC